MLRIIEVEVSRKNTSSRKTTSTRGVISRMLRFRGAKSVKLCALLDKAAAREVDVPIDYRGFEIENVFVVGYGLDLDQIYRNLPFIGVLDGEAMAEGSST